MYKITTPAPRPAPLAPFSAPAPRCNEGRPWADWLLVGLMAILGFLLGCFQMIDTDVWWHVRAGQWILANRRVPVLDPFTFASAHRPWIDLHWAFQVVLAWAYGQGGVAAMIVLAAAVGTAALLTVLTARRRAWPTWVGVLCWLPALLLMSGRFYPRPEVFTLLYTAGFLAVLLRIDRHPALVWVLPVIELLWVNTQGLFIFGPIILGFAMIDRGIRSIGDRRRGVPPAAEPRCWWRHVGPAAGAVGLACLANPYFVHGALFPLELFHKMTERGGPYNAYIAELWSPQRFIQNSAPGLAAANPYFRAHLFLLLTLPLSFLLPATWRAARAGSAGGDRAAWLIGLTVAVGLLLVTVLTLPGIGVPGWVILVGQTVPALTLAAAAVVAARFGWRSRASAGLTLAGGAAVAALMVWLRSVLLGPEPGPWGWLDRAAHPGPTLVAAGLGLAAAAGAAVLVVRWGGSTFRLLLAAAFGYLSLQATRNSNHFALVAGTVIAWNFGEWAAQLAAAPPAGRRPAGAARAVRIVLVGLIGLWIAGVVTDRFYAWAGEGRHFGFEEKPFWYAHDAARFAGRSGMPDRALVYHIGQTGVYLFHNGPRRKLFMDSRLEIPELHTFNTYKDVGVWLNQDNPWWVAAVEHMGDPLILLDHQQDFGAEAALLDHSPWRCVYYDAVALVFVPRRRADLDAPYPTVDFAARHFHRPLPALVPDRPGAAHAEARSLYNLGVARARLAGPGGTAHVPVLLLALDRARQAIPQAPDQPGGWTILGNCYGALQLTATEPPPGPAAAWDPVTGLTWAQSTYCYNQALARAPGDVMAAMYLYQSFKVRDLADAQLAIGERLLRGRPTTAEQARFIAGQAAAIARLRRRLRAPRLPLWSNLNDLHQAVGALLDEHRPEAAVRLVEEAERRGRVPWSWPMAERIGAAELHLGRPADARRLWTGQAGRAPSESLRLCRIAATYAAELDVARAVRWYREAQMADPKQADAWWGLALLLTQQGQAAEALAACRGGLRLALPDRQRRALEDLQRLVAPYAGPVGSRTDARLPAPSSAFSSSSRTRFASVGERS